MGRGGQRHGRRSTSSSTDRLNEWTETETWSGVLAGRMRPVNAIVTSLPVRLVRPPRASSTCPTRSPAGRWSARAAGKWRLPSNVVIDLTTWATTHERSRFPLPPTGNGVSTSQVVNPNTGSVDIVVNPDGTVVPSTVYSTPVVVRAQRLRSSTSGWPSGATSLRPTRSRLAYSTPPDSAAARRASRRRTVQPPAPSSRGSTAW